jgi:hypothetical protein
MSSLARQKRKGEERERGCPPVNQMLHATCYLACACSCSHFDEECKGSLTVARSTRGRWVTALAGRGSWQSRVLASEPRSSRCVQDICKMQSRRSRRRATSLQPASLSFSLPVLPSCGFPVNKGRGRVPAVREVTLWTRTKRKDRERESIRRTSRAEQSSSEVIGSPPFRSLSMLRFARPGVSAACTVRYGQDRRLK